MGEKKKSLETTRKQNCDTKAKNRLAGSLEPSERESEKAKAKNKKHKKEKKNKNKKHRNKKTHTKTQQRQQNTKPRSFISLFYSFLLRITRFYII